MLRENIYVMPGDLVMVYPKHPYTGYIIKIALYSKQEVLDIPDNHAFLNDSKSKHVKALYHHIITTAGVMVLPDDIYTVEKIKDPEKCE
jgi:hypothetical protein